MKLRIFNKLKNFFVAKEPEERTGEEWEQYFSIAEVLRNNRNVIERRNRRRNINGKV